VKPVVFQYVRATSVDDAVRCLIDAAGEGKILAGGQSLGPLLNMRLARPAVLVDVNAIPDLKTIAASETTIRLGATVRQREAERSPLVARRLPLMRAALPFIGHTQTRNRGTVVGSIVHADPSAELPLVATCLDAVIELVGPGGAREVAIADFYLGALTADVAEDEIAVAIRFASTIPAPDVRRGAGFHEAARRRGDFALVAAAAQLDVDTRSGRVVDARLGLTGVGDAPVRLAESERALVGSAEPAAHFATIAAAAAGTIDPPSDLHATAAYRKTVARTLLERALADAWSRA